MTSRVKEASRTAPDLQERMSPLLRYVLVLFAVIGTVTILALGSSLFILLFVAGIFSFLLLPFCRKL